MYYRVDKVGHLESYEQKISEVSYRKFIDYKTGKPYPNSDSLDISDYWKPMREVFSDYIKHNDAKFDGETGQLKLKHLKINKSSIHYIGKESNELEKSEFLVVFKEDTVEYVNHQKKLRGIIESLTLEKVLEIGISRRTYFDWKKKIKERMVIVLKSKHTLKLIQYYLQ